MSNVKRQMYYMYYKKAFGNLGENIAADYLHSLNYQIIDRNFHCHFGEIDIIAEKDDLLIFFEVKTRKVDSEIPPEETVDYRKQQKLIKATEYYLGKNGLTEKDWRIDILGIELDKNNKFRDIEHIEGAIEE